MTRASRAELTVNGVPVDGRIHVLNHFSIRIRLGLLEYVFEYADFASTSRFPIQRRE
jgi:hypothetical protein